MGFELARYETTVAVREQVAYQDEPSFFDHIRQQAARALAEQIMREGSIYRRIDPSEEEKLNDPFAPVRHRWSIGIQRDLSELEARERDIEAARKLGLAQAAAIVRGMVSSYDRAEGSCKHVLVHQLEEIARTLQAHATARANT